MQLKSTNNQAPIVGFPEALFQGLAPDGGLYVPVEEADLKQRLRSLGPADDFPAVAATVVEGLLGDTLGDPLEFARSTFPFAPELRDLGNGIYVLELWHGPSAAFKDYGAAFLAASMERLLTDRNQRAIILTATSGDTGSAVAQAFHNRENIDVVILYPEGRVSPLQEKQLTTLGGNIHALRVQGAFDDCQRMVKEAFMDRDLCAKVPLTSANSINIGRLIPQSFYYVWAHAQLKDANAGERMFVVPSGNFGNLTAGVMAWRWGLPIDAFLAATNANDVVPEYLETGIYTPRESVATYSNAMDVGRPSNFDRLMHIFGNSLESVRSMIGGEVVNDTETLALMQRYHRSKGVFLDPHTAVGVAAAERRIKDYTGGRIIVLGTAHPGKFLEVVEQATGVQPPLPDRLQSVLAKQGQSEPIAAEAAALRARLIEWFHA
ncbi:threonine synthase [Spirochaeta africana]|uniref:Threonine synthase n=1 Tax=Spirochaeta africana (strain ATCC 700263 / DSM 8902 / Z-7692) TaxID=889378 RepID=H9UMP4_SPIAZ|nr:threonine synthase [Spirochaeta africana]AFG38787.1 threonine synthase [Spirochaeta africana DSM 8902]